MERKAASRILWTALILVILLSVSKQVGLVHAPSSMPYTDFHDLMNANTNNLQAIVGFAYEPFDQPGLWLSLGELNPYFIDPWYDNNNFVPANGRLLISVQDVSPLSEQIFAVEFDTGSLSEIYVPSTGGTTDWLYLWVADDGSTYYDRDMTLLARAPPVVSATVDVKPDKVKLESKGGWIKVYIELPQGYSVSNIDVSTIRVNGEVEAMPDPTAIGDYDRDLVPDLMVRFDRPAVTALLEVGEAVLSVTGEVDGAPFEGSATLEVVDKNVVPQYSILFCLHCPAPRYVLP